MRSIAAVVVAAGLLVGCSSGTKPSDSQQHQSTEPEATGVAADCLPMVRYDRRAYYAVGYTSKAAKKVGTAVKSECDDTSRDARGVYFPDKAPGVTAYALRHAPPSVAVAISEGPTYGVYISTDIGIAKAERMLLHKLNGRFDPIN